MPGTSYSPLDASARHTSQAPRDWLAYVKDQSAWNDGPGTASCLARTSARSRGDMRRVCHPRRRAGADPAIWSGRRTRQNAVRYPFLWRSLMTGVTVAEISFDGRVAIVTGA